IAPQRAEAGARCVDEHAVDLRGETLHPRIALVCEPLRMHVREARPREPGLQLGKPPLVRVESVKPTLRAHQRAEEKRLAAGACAEVDDHLRSFWCNEVAEELASFVL